MNIEAALRDGCALCGQPWKVGDKITHEQLDDVVYAYHRDPSQCERNEIEA